MIRNVHIKHYLTQHMQLSVLFRSLYAKHGLGVPTGLGILGADQRVALRSKDETVNISYESRQHFLICRVLIMHLREDP